MEELKNNSELSQLSGREELSDAYISFQINLAEITKKYTKLILPLEVDFPEKEIIHNKFENGFPLIGFAPISLPLKILTSCFSEIISVFQSHQICSEDVSAWFESHADKQLLKRIIKAIISFDKDTIEELSEPAPLDSSTLNLIGRELVKPFFHSIAIYSKNIVSFQNWTEGFCPICGDLPSFARFSKEEEGKRYLWCARCDMEWGFQRICCPFCKNSDHTKLKFLTTNYREELRIDVCDDCKGYVKTIDERKFEEDYVTIYIKEHVSSLFLDMVAEEKGYLIQLPAIQNIRITFDTEHKFH